MSVKSKQLTYGRASGLCNSPGLTKSVEMEQPAFLRRLKEETSGQAQEKRYIAPRNKKTVTDELEDEPAYVLEDGQQLSAAEFKKLSEGGDETSGEVTEAPKLPQMPLPKQEASVTIGTKKRKLAKAIGQSDDESSSEQKSFKTKVEENPVNISDDGPSKSSKGDSKSKAKKPKPKKKALKLSFDDE